MFGQLPFESKRTLFSSSLGAPAHVDCIQALANVRALTKCQLKQALERRERLEESRPILLHARHLRLLQHDLGNEHSIGIIDIAPGKIAMMLSPFAPHLANESVEIGGIFSGSFHEQSRG